MKFNLGIWRDHKRLIFSTAIVLGFSHIASAQNTGAPLPQPSSSVWALPQSLVDRSVLTVEKKVYALSDVYALIALWKIALPQDKLSQISNWADGSGYQFNRERSFLRQFEKWPTDVQRVLFIVLSWPESSQRGVLAPTDEELQSIISKVRSPKASAELDPRLLQAILILPQATLQERANQVLRTLALQKDQSGLNESAGFRQWFWHQRISNGETPSK